MTYFANVRKTSTFFHTSLDTDLLLRRRPSCFSYFCLFWFKEIFHFFFLWPGSPRRVSFPLFKTTACRNYQLPDFPLTTLSPPRFFFLLCDMLMGFSPFDCCIDPFHWLSQYPPRSSGSPQLFHLTTNPNNNSPFPPEIKLPPLPLSY